MTEAVYYREEFLMVDIYIAKLVQYGIDSGLIPAEERVYSINQILEVLEKDDYEAPEETFTDVDLADTLEHIMDRRR